MSHTSQLTRGTAQVVAILKQGLIAEANAAHAQYPQYAGHWDGWRVVEITERQIGKGNRGQFEIGDIVLCAPTTETHPVAPSGKMRPVSEWPTVEFATCYSRRTHMDTAVRVGNFRDIIVTDS